MGLPHARIMEDRGLVLEEYLAWLRAFPPEAPLDAGGYSLCRLPAGGEAAPPPGGRWKLEDTNDGGAVLTVWRDRP